MGFSFLVTGGAGFIGSHLCELLLKEGHKVVAIDNLSTGRLENIEHLRPDPDFLFVRETINNSLVLDRLASESQIIVHLAAAVGVKLIVEDPVHTIRTNIMGTEAVLNAANRYGCKVLIASTSEVYGKGVQIPFQEGDDRLMGPTSHSRWSYAASKAIDEFMGLAFFNQFGLPVIITRLFNTVGPRQVGQYGMVVPRLIRQALLGETLTVFGDGLQSRCFADVNDVTAALLQLALHPQAVGDVFNIGTTDEVTILQLANRILHLTESGSHIQFIPYSEAYAPGFDDMRRRVPSIQKIRDLIGYAPKYSLDETLKRIIDYELLKLQTRPDAVRP